MRGSKLVIRLRSFWYFGKLVAEEGWLLTRDQEVVAARGLTVVTFSRFQHRVHGQITCE